MFMVTAFIIIKAYRIFLEKNLGNIVNFEFGWHAIP